MVSMPCPGGDSGGASAASSLRMRESMPRTPAAAGPTPLMLRAAPWRDCSCMSARPT